MNEQFFVNVGRQTLLRDGQMTCLHSLSIIPNNDSTQIDFFPVFCQDAGDYEVVRSRLHKYIDDIFDAAQNKGKFAK